MTKRFAVIGNPIAHSLSPVIHDYFGQQNQIALSYEKLQGDESLFSQQVFNFFAEDGKGMNVTLPFKRQAFNMAVIKTERCQKAGAANTLWMKDSKLHADNTDGIGLINDLEQYLNLSKKRILILGAGGATRGIIMPILAAHPEMLMIANRGIEKITELQSDFPQPHYTTLDQLSGVYDVIINATSASLGGDSISLSEEIMNHKPFCYDLAYKQKADTPFVNYAKGWGCKATDGLGMLVEQAAEAFYIWHGVRPETRKLIDLLRH